MAVKNMVKKNDVFDVYYDSLTEADWFASLNPAFDIENNRYHVIKKRGKNVPLVDKITEYDKPDIILIRNGVPLLVIEVTQEVPTGHNVGQRFARLVRAVELGIPTIYFFPFDAKKHGKYASICNLNIRLLAAAKKMFEIHDTPLLCVNWPTDLNGEIIVDGSENDVISKLLESYFESDFDTKCRSIQEHLNFMNEEYNNRLKKRPSYADLPPSVTKVKTSDLMKIFGLEVVTYSFKNRPYTYIYRMDMTPEKCKRQDPYTGTIFIYDYIVCRTGVNVSDKKNNIVLHFPNITVSTWEANNPNNPKTKSSNWYLTANMFIFKDGHILVRG